MIVASSDEVRSAHLRESDNGILYLIARHSEILR